MKKPGPDRTGLKRVTANFNLEKRGMNDVYRGNIQAVSDAVIRDAAFDERMLQMSQDALAACHAKPSTGTIIKRKRASK